MVVDVGCIVCVGECGLVCACECGVGERSVFSGE